MNDVSNRYEGHVTISLNVYCVRRITVKFQVIFKIFRFTPSTVEVT